DDLDDIANCPGNPACGDCNTNGTPDECDISTGVSPDCGGNGVPDECETDCNCNGTDDATDIANGFSEDADSNGVPDECIVWVFTAGEWSNPAYWDPPVVPDNAGADTYLATIGGATADVTLDIDAEINGLGVLSNARLDVADGSLTIMQSAGLFNGGTITVADGRSVYAGADFTLSG
ncbi:MAG: hypothetical protein L6Q99_22725, partial [Planctomycetes bacterium]|nr:hypothetical protein [Planctomycetota bacterium]